jgi:hypothetical protein
MQTIRCRHAGTGCFLTNVGGNQSFHFRWINLHSDMPAVVFRNFTVAVPRHRTSQRVIGSCALSVRRRADTVCYGVAGAFAAEDLKVTCGQTYVVRNASGLFISLRPLNAILNRHPAPVSSGPGTGDMRAERCNLSSRMLLIEPGG